MREKLIEILRACPYRPRSGLLWVLIASHFIANGVTVQQWIPVTERLPEEDTRVLVWLLDDTNKYTRMDTDRRHNGKWVRWEKYVTHWMPLPQPPKEG